MDPQICSNVKKKIHTEERKRNMRFSEETCLSDRKGPSAEMGREPSVPYDLGLKRLFWNQILLCLPFHFRVTLGKLSDLSVAQFP